MSPHANNKRDVMMPNALYPPPLKINKDSHFIKKPSSSSSSSPSSSSSSSSTTSSLVNAVAAGSVGAKPPPQQQQRHPVIIYTHSPKVIHTHPRDFMALVQKLTGLSRFEDEGAPVAAKAEAEEDTAMNKKVGMRNDQDNESSSVITEENNCNSSRNINNNNSKNNNNNNNNVGGGGGGGDQGGQVMNSCFVPPNPYFQNIPVFTPNAADFLCSNSINLFTPL